VPLQTLTPMRCMRKVPPSAGRSGAGALPSARGEARPLLSRRDGLRLDASSVRSRSSTMPKPPSSSPGAACGDPQFPQRPHRVASRPTTVQGEGDRAAGLGQRVGGNAPPPPAE
jgi:hypothetical protein